jgi:hypothetical protein
MGVVKILEIYIAAIKADGCISVLFIILGNLGKI